MKTAEGDIFSFHEETFIKEDYLNYYTYFLVTKEAFEKEKTKKINIFDFENNKVDLMADNIGKYSIKYIQGIKSNEKLFYFKNSLKENFQYETNYFEGYDDIAIFNFLTGSKKSGKTFSLLDINIFSGKANNYRLYLNDKYITELEKEDKREEILNMFFYEISQIFKTYEEYVEFSKKFSEKIIGGKLGDNIENIEFQDFLLNFIDELDSFVEKNKDRYKKMMIIFDDFELDETNPEKFKKNNNFINILYNKRCKRSKIHFSFISNINNNYIQKCVQLDLDLKNKGATAGFTRKDDKTGVVFYPFTFYNTCFYDSDNSFDYYKKKVSKKNDDEIKVSKTTLEQINYSLFHLNCMKEKYNKGKKGLTAVKDSEEEYLNELKEEGEKIVNKFYRNDNDLYIFNFEKVEKYHKLISDGNIKNIECEIAIDILNYIPITFLNIFTIKERDHKGNSKLKFNISYLYQFYKNSILKYLSQFKNANYEENKEMKPGSKGDSLEEKVIESIKLGYFDNFKPDEIIEIDAIYKLREFKYNKRNEYDEYIKKFEKIFSSREKKLIMIVQTNPYAKPYDLAFLQQYKNGKYQFIISQITRNKSREEMLEYLKVNQDCYNFADFFSLFDNIEVRRYHFFFIFQAGIEHNKKAIEFCINNSINYIKFCLVDKKPNFFDSDDIIIKKIFFDKQSSSMAYLIGNKEIKEEGTNSIEYSLLGKKRENNIEIFEAKYALGAFIYSETLKILKCNNFELCKINYALKEGEIFHIYYRIGENKKKIYYLVYLKNEKKIIEIINKEKDSKKKDDGKILEKELYKYVMKFKCFKIID